MKYEKQNISTLLGRYEMSRDAATRLPTQQPLCVRAILHSHNHRYSQRSEFLLKLSQHVKYETLDRKQYQRQMNSSS